MQRCARDTAFGSPVATVDYSHYVEHQTAWAESLRKAALAGEPERARELGEITAATLRRMLRFACRERGGPRMVSACVTPQRKIGSS